MILTVFDFLVDLFGDVHALKRAIDKTLFTTSFSVNLEIKEKHVARLCGELILLADIDNNKLKATEGVQKPYGVDLGEKLYRYQIKMYDPKNERLSAYLTTDSGEPIQSVDNVDIKLVIQKAYDSYSKLEKHQHNSQPHLMQGNNKL